MVYMQIFIFSHTGITISKSNPFKISIPTVVLGSDNRLALQHE